MVNVTKTRGLKIAHLNVRSLRHKFDQLRLELTKNCSFDVLTVSAIKSRSSYHWAMYKKLRINYVDKEVQACKSHYYKQSIEESKGDVSKVWKAINEASL